jgi:serine/threonine-protein kinase
MKVAQYELKNVLGTGGMGTVWHAVDGSLKRDVAIKVLPEATASDPEFRARFLREARLAARLNHPNIATIFSVEEHESTLYLVMELVKGASLDQLIAGRPLAIDAAVGIMLQVAAAIEEAHAHGIIHRDIKPENIMVSPRGVKVLDFGIARELVPLEDARMTQAGTVMGTPHCMSPEQAQGHELNEQSDIFSLGAVLYEMLTGRPAFDAETMIGVLLQVVTKLHPPLADVPIELAAVVDRCLEKKPSARFRRIARALLEEMGYGVDEASDGAEAIRRLKTGRYELLITDLLMPRLDGWNVIDFIRGYAARRPAHVLVTSMMANVTLGEVDREIVEGVIAKPITRAKLQQFLGAA